MKKLHVKISFTKQKKYTVHLGNCEWLESKSKTFIKLHIRKYKRVIEDNVSMLSTLQSNAYELYRLYYLNLNNKISRKTKESLHLFDDSFDFIFKKFTDGNTSFVFSSIENCYFILLETLGILKEFARSYKIYSLSHQCSTLLKHIDCLYNNFIEDKYNLQSDISYLNVKSMRVIHLNSKAV